MSIRAIEAGIEALVAQVTDIQKTYTYPVTDLPHLSPLLVVLYTGFRQKPGPARATYTEWLFDFDLLLLADGQLLKPAWDQTKDLAEAILAKFRASPTVNGSCWGSLIHEGEAFYVIPSPDNPRQRHLGHTFHLVAHKEET